MAGQYAIIWFIFFLNIMAGISIVSFLSPLYQDIWRLDHPTLESSILAGYGATLIAVSSLFNGFGRIVWGAVSEWLGRINTFRLLLASQLIVFGILMTEHNPWVFAILVCYVLSCFGGGFAIMPPMVIDVYGQKRMSRVYGIILTAWSAAGILGPMMVASLKDNYPESRHRLLVSARYPRARGRLHLQLSRQRRPVHTAAHPPPDLRHGAAPRCATPKSPRGKRRIVRYKLPAVPQDSLLLLLAD